VLYRPYKIRKVPKAWTTVLQTPGTHPEF